MEITKKIKVTTQNIADLMVTAFEGGINYWCGKVEIISNPADKDWASDVVAFGGELRLTDVEDDTEQWTLTLPKLLAGLSKTLDWGNFKDVEELMDSHDAETADVLVQYALFDEIVFG